MTILRNLEPGDLPHLPGLLAALDREPVPWNAAWLEHKIYQDPDYDPALSPIFEDSGRPVALVHGVIRGGGEIASLKVMAVEKSYRRRGLATQLLDIFESRAREAGAVRIQLFFAPPCYLIPGIDPGYAEALDLMMRRGYQTERNCIVNMEVELDPVLLNTQADEARLKALGYMTRRAQPDDRDEAAELGYRIGGVWWRDEVLDAFSYEPIRLYVAAGPTGALVSFAAQDVVGPILFGPTGTDPAARRLGIGTVLLKRCLADVLAQGYPKALISGAGPIAFYTRAVGARVCRVFWPFEKSLVEETGKFSEA
jgi:GNAT superfamily N-acetyltransferase